MDIDIITIHTRILALLEEEIEKVPELDRKLERLQYILDTVSLRDDIKRNVEREILELETRRKKLSSRSDYNFYVLDVSALITEYKKELNKPVELNFMGKPQKPISERKLQIQKEFYKIARQYLPDILKSESIDTSTCSRCGQSTIEHASSFVCSSCGLDQEISRSMISYKDNERVSVTTKYTYTRRIHFRDCINQFQGKQQSSIPQNIYDQIYEMLRSHGLELPGNSREEKYKNVTKRHIGIFLREIGEANRYEDRNLIYHQITGKKLDDISHLEEDLMRDFDILDELYEQMFIQTKVINRKNFIHTQYILYQLLRRHGYKCNKSDFNLLKTTELKLFQDEICAQLFEKLGWNFQCVTG